MPGKCVLFSNPSSKSMSLAAIEPKPIELRLSTELRLPRQKNVVADERREDGKDVASEVAPRFGAVKLSSLKDGLFEDATEPRFEVGKSSSLNDSLFEDAMEHRLRSLRMEEYVEPSEIEVGMVDVVEYLRLLLKREDIGVAGPILSKILDVSLFVSLHSSSIEAIGISSRGSWVGASVVGLTHSSSSSSESESSLRKLTSI